MPLVRRCVGTLLLALAIGGCRPAKPVADDVVARQALADLQAGRTGAVLGRLDPTLVTQTTDAPAALRTLADSLRPYLPVDSAKLVGWNIVDRPDDHSATLTYELRGHGHWALTSVTLHGQGAAARIFGMHYEAEPASLATANAFTLAHKSAKHYAFLALALAAAAFAIGSAILLAATRSMPRRWGWALVALVGVGVFRLNWSTGESAVQPLQVQLFSAGFAKAGEVAPWLLSFALPLGAVVALTRRRQRLQALRHARAAEPAGSQAPAA